MKSKNDFQRWEIHSQSGSQLRNPAPDLMDFYVLRFFREIQKGSPLEGVSMKLIITFGYKKKKRTDFSASKSVFGLHFLQQNPISLFQNFNPDLPIESTQNFRAAFPIFYKYSRLLWTLLNRNMIVFIKPTAFRHFDHLIKAILSSSFFKIGWSTSSLRVAVLGGGRVRLHIG